jgi:hypothetical protein
MPRRGGPDRSGTTGDRNLYLLSALLPLVPATISVVAAIELGGWSGITASLVRAVTPDALLYSAVCVVVAAPIAGVGVRSARRLAVATAVFCAVSAGLTVARLGASAEAVRFAASSHAVLASATLALAGLGALLGTLLRDALDAAALAVGIAAIAAYGVLVAGGPVGELPGPVLTAALLASPVMSVASAAHVDLVRSDIWYQISPLAHIQVEYPSWGTICAAYLLAGCTAFLAVTRHRTGRRRVPVLKQGL